MKKTTNAVQNSNYLFHLKQARRIVSNRPINNYGWMVLAQIPVRKYGRRCRWTGYTGWMVGPQGQLYGELQNYVHILPGIE